MPRLIHGIPPNHLRSDPVIRSLPVVYSHHHYKLFGTLVRAVQWLLHPRYYRPLLLRTIIKERHCLRCAIKELPCRVILLRNPTPNHSMHGVTRLDRLLYLLSLQISNA